MDDDLDFLESELKQLQPARTPPRLEQRIATELTRTPARSRTWWMTFAALPIAAAVAIAISLPHRNQITPTPKSTAASAQGTADAGDILKPVSAENVLYSAEEEGMVTLDDGTPARRERLRYVDTITFQNPRTHASLKWTVPRDEIRVIPVNYQ